MQFAPRRKKPTFEERLARWSIGLLGGSIVIIAVLVTLAFTIANKSIWFFLATACLGVYVAQFYYLGRIGKFEPKQRLSIWQLSLVGHVLLFGVVLWVVGQPSVALVVLLPEAASGVVHLVGMSRAFKALQAA